MRIFLIISVIVVALKQAQCKIKLKHDKEVIIDIDSPELHQSQYHTADFNTSAYNYGYAVEPNGQFHHETRGGDGVTYGCYGYIDTDDLLKVTHYVADSQGYRTLEHEKPVLVYPIDENAVDTYDRSYKPKSVMLNWKDLYFPIGCGMAKGGIILNAPVVRAPNGHFKQLGETKIPVPPSNEPKVVVPRIAPIDVGIKTVPTKLIPINGSNIGSQNNIQLKVATSRPFASTPYVSPSTKSSSGTTNSQSVTTKTPSINVHVNDPDHSKQPTDGRVQPTLSPTRFPNTFGEFIAPFKEPVTVRVPSTRFSTTFGETLAPFIEPVTVRVPSTRFSNTFGETLTSSKEPVISSVPSTRFPTTFGETIAPFKEPVTVRVPSTRFPTTFGETLAPFIEPVTVRVPSTRFSNTFGETLTPSKEPVISSVPSTRFPTTFGETIAPFKEPVTVRVPSTRFPTTFGETLAPFIEPVNVRVPSTRFPNTFGETFAQFKEPEVVRVPSTRFPNTFGETLPPFKEPVTSRVPSTRFPNTFGETLAPYRESVTVRVPTNSIKLNPLSVSPINKLGVDKGYTPDNDEELLPPSKTTNYVSDRPTTISVPISSSNRNDDFNTVNSYAQINSGSGITTKTGYSSEDKPTRTPIRNNVFSNNNSGPFALSDDDSGSSTFSTFIPTTFPSTEKINHISTSKKSQFDAFKFNYQATTEVPIEIATEQYSEPTTVLTTQTDPISSTFDEIIPYTRQPPTDGTYQTSTDGTYQTSNKFSGIKDDSSRISSFPNTESSTSQRPFVETSTASKVTPIIVKDSETSKSQATYPGIGDYKKPAFGLEFNIPSRAPITASTGSFDDSFVTISNQKPTINDLSNQDTGDYEVDGKAPNYEKTSQFTNGPHGAEYQLHSGIAAHPDRNQGYNYRNAFKQSRKEVDSDDRPVSLISPLTHLAISGTYPSAKDVTVSPTQTEKPSRGTAKFFSDHSTNGQTSIFPKITNSFGGFNPQVSTQVRQNTIQPERELTSTKAQPSVDFFALNNTPKTLSPGIITHMEPIPQTRFQSNRVTPSLISVTSNDQKSPNELTFDPESRYYKSPETTQTRQQEVSKSTVAPFVYTRQFAPISVTENLPYPIESSSFTYSNDLVTKAPSENTNLDFGSFGQRIKPATSSAYNRGSTSRTNTVDNNITPSPVQDTNYKPFNNFENSPKYEPKFVLKQSTVPANANIQPIPNFNGYTDFENRNGNFNPNFIQQKSIEVNKNVNNEIQPETKFVNTKKEFIPQYNPNSTPIPGSYGTAIGVYPPNLDELSADIPNFSIAISKWPFYIVPFPFGDGNIMSFPFINGGPFPLGNGNNIPLSSGNGNVNGVYGANGSGEQSAQSICSWLSSFIKPQESVTNAEIPTNTNANGETLEISNLQVNIKNPQFQINPNAVPFGIVGFIPIIAVPKCQHNVNGDKSAEPSAFTTNIQIPSLCSQLTHLIGSHTNERKTNQPPPA